MNKPVGDLSGPALRLFLFDGLEGPDLHLVMDNYATHKTPKIKAWLARRPH